MTTQMEQAAIDAAIGFMSEGGPDSLSSGEVATILRVLRRYEEGLAAITEHPDVPPSCFRIATEVLFGN